MNKTISENEENYAKIVLKLHEENIYVTSGWEGFEVGCVVEGSIGDVSTNTVPVVKGFAWTYFSSFTYIIYKTLSKDWISAWIKQEATKEWSSILSTPLTVSQKIYKGVDHNCSQYTTSVI